MTDPKFSPGDRVVFTNEFGVCWGVKTITSQEPPLTEGGPLRYHYANSDTPWYPVSEVNLKAADAEDLDWAGQDWEEVAMLFQAKHGRPTTRAELDSLLYTDPWDGEVDF